MTGEGADKKLTNKQRVFVEEYLRDFNATQAAIRAGYSKRTAYSIGQRLLKNVEVNGAIQQRVDEKVMKTDEILSRLSDMARADMGDFVQIDGSFFNLDLGKANEAGLTHLIKKVKDRVIMTSNKDGEETETHYLEIELHDSQSALVHLGKINNLFIERKDITSGGEPINVTIKGIDD